MSGAVSAWTAPTPAAGRDLPTDTHVLICPDSPYLLLILPGLKDVLRMENKRCLRSWPLLSFLEKEKCKFGEEII